MKKLFSLFLLFIIVLSTFAQNLKWAKGMGGSGIDQANIVVVDDSGNVYTAGYFRVTADFDPGPGTFMISPIGRTDAFISKLDASGNFVWAKSMGGPDFVQAFSMAVDRSGNIYITGNFSGQADFDPGPGVYDLTANAFSDIFILKLDASGNFVWAEGFGGTSNNEGEALTLDASGNVYTTGWFTGTADFDPGTGTAMLTSKGQYDLFILKLSPQGTYIWAKGIGGPETDGGLTITIDKTGSVYIGGAFKNGVDFDPSPGIYYLNSFGNFDIFVLKLNPSGNFVWAKRIGGSDEDQATSVKVDALGMLYVTGYYSGPVDFDPGSGIHYMNSDSAPWDIFIMKLDSAGKFKWSKSIGGKGYDYANALALDATCNIYITGIYYKTVDFDPGAGNYSMTAAGNADIFVTILDSSGNFEWTKSMGGTNLDYSSSLFLDSSKNIYLCGYFYGSADFDAGTAGSSLTSAGLADIFVSKIISTPLPMEAMTGPSQACAGATITYSTNAPGATNYTWTVPAGATIMSGQNTMSIQVLFGTGSGNITVRASNSLGKGDSAALFVTLSPVPVITIQPSEKIVTEGSGVQMITASSTPGVLYQWQMNSGSGFTDLSNIGQYSGVTSGTLTVTGLGVLQNNYKFRCIITNGSCKYPTNEALLKVYKTGLNSQLQKNNLHVFPNPAKYSVTVRSDIALKAFHYAVTNSTGKEVLNGELNNTLSIDISLLPPGLYFVEIGDPDQRDFFKLVKE